MFAYDILIKQPERTLFADVPEQNIRIGTFFAKKADVVKRAKIIQKVLGKQVTVSVIRIKVISKNCE